MSRPSDSAALSSAFITLVDLIRRLRSENGCPWDRKQTPQSFHPYILEEYHEMVHALNCGDPADIADEMGDLMFLVVFVACMFEEQGIRSVAAMMEGAIEKMTRRHPHVFGDAQVKDAQDVVDNWRRIKAAEENIRRRESLLDGIPRSLPALGRAQKLARKAASVGFDWTQASEVIAKVDEELKEFKDAAAAGSSAAIREELGDLLFVVANAARHFDVNSEAALNEASDKFERRFRYIEARLKSLGRSPCQSALAEMDKLWDEAKDKEKTGA
jgi:MazG family protein